MIFWHPENHDRTMTDQPGEMQRLLPGEDRHGAAPTPHSSTLCVAEGCQLRYTRPLATNVVYQKQPRVFARDGTLKGSDMLRMMQWIVGAVALFFATASPVHADFDYTDFSSLAGLTLVQDASPSGPFVNLTSQVLSQKGALWTDTPQPISAGFDTTFTIEHALASGGADGSAFVIQNGGATALGNHAAALGYGGFLTTPNEGIPSSVAIEFDDFSNTNFNDPSSNHLSVQTRGALPNSSDHQFSLGSTSAIAPIAGVHTARVVYLPGSPGTLNVYFDDLVTPVLSVAIDLVAEVSGTSAYLGFTASTGGEAEAHRVRAWSLTLSGGNPTVQFRRGDCNDDASANIADAIFLLSVLFPAQGNPPPVPCQDSCDGNDDGNLNIADAIAILNSLFSPIPAPLPPPFGACGNDPSIGDTLICPAQNGC